MATPYTILIRNNDGVIGAAVYDTPTSDARPILAADWPEIGKAVNAASLERIGVLEAEVADLRAYKQSVIDKATRLRADALDPEKDTQAATLAATAEVLASEQAKQRAELLAQKAEIQAKLDALQP